MMALLDVERAQVSRSAGGAVTFDDPECPFVVKVWAGRRRRGVPGMSRLSITARTGEAEIAPAQLTRLPLSQMLNIATTEGTGTREWPNETYYRMLAKPKPAGSQSWPYEHWATVLTIFRWARETGRPGGGLRAVADLWGVSRKPTAQRWLTEAYRRERTRSQ